MRTTLPMVVCAALCLKASIQDAPGAAFRVHDDRSSYKAALAGVPALNQDFSNLRGGRDMQGVPFLPAVFATSSLPYIVVHAQSLFGYGGSVRERGDAYYDFHFGKTYRAISFDVTAWNPASPGPAVVEVFFADGTDATLERYQTSGSESQPVFFGLISETPITLVRWHETPEIYGFGNEEVSFDNFAVVPEPPAITEVSVTPSTLWPPNNKMVMVSASTLVEEGGGDTEWRVIRIDCDQTLNADDVRVVDDHTVGLRATRSGRADSRTYTLWLVASDAIGNESEPVSVEVTVAHDQRN